MDIEQVIFHKDLTCFLLIFSSLSIEPKKVEDLQLGQGKYSKISQRPDLHQINLCNVRSFHADCLLPAYSHVGKYFFHVVHFSFLFVIALMP
jgi:hypothetical protein